MRIFIVLHHEITGTPANWWADEMVFYTASSLEKAVTLIKKARINRSSWWEIQIHDVDSSAWPEHVGYYGPRGGKLRRSPKGKCVAFFKKKGQEGGSSSDEESADAEDESDP